MPDKFDELGIDKELLSAIEDFGYRKLTPIQKITIPIALEGKDVVVMARTGSGKTASFLIPVIHKLKSHSDDGIRAMIISPTRDLALQTANFFSKIGKYSDLTCAVVVGGESMEDQFLALLKNPDIVIGTPGRILHVITEMQLSVRKVNMIIFDEADRLYEMGLMQELRDIIKQTSNLRQTMLVSATLPKSLLQFSSIEMQEAQFLRLDSDSTLSDKLKLFQFFVKNDFKIPTLAFLLTKIINKSDQTIIFAQSKHHVDMLQEVLNVIGISCSISYSRMDEENRRINMNNFRYGKTHVMISTDIAARGLDIPSLDNVINYNFPTSSKIFVHRAGRVARAGREGFGYSLVSLEELPYLLDLYQNIQKELNICSSNIKNSLDNILGSVPQTLVDWVNEKYGFTQNTLLKNLIETSINSEKKIKNYSQKSSVEAIHLSKSLNLSSIYAHPLFILNNKEEFNLTKFTTVGFKPKKKPIGTELDSIFQAKENMKIKPKFKKIKSKTRTNLTLNKKSNNTITYKKFSDSFCLPQRPVDDSREKIYKLEEFKNSDGLTVDLIDDEIENIKRNKKNYREKWDRKSKRYVNVEIKRKKKIKTESGIEVNSMYATNHYKKWLKKTGINSIIKSKNSDGKLAKIDGYIPNRTQKSKKKNIQHKSNNKNNPKRNFKVKNNRK